MSPKTSLARREKNIVGPPFPEGVSPVGTFLGEDDAFGRRLGSGQDLRNGTISLG